ncbi:uncharacterized protein LOC108042883 [Drosophila rhopaloa]|uniref:Uncharacterized protein LOC108042883 n=1 Tax=Drosophila rhopaloa TaxID=1041015 RepID=A0A6P4EUT0_DRORH|nr:uncharacterized protein LOC108042883 [Drosophila rhopaloa]
MFQKRIIEMITVLVYWVIITPTIYNYCKQSGIIRMSIDSLVATVGDHCTLALCLMIGYVVFYRIIIFIYMKFKVCDIRMWDELQRAKEDPEAHLDKKSYYQPVSTENIDVVDSGSKKKSKPGTPKMIRTISNPLLIESDLARIHIKHETRPLESATLPRLQQAQVHPSPSPSLRCAPPVPQMQKSAILPNQHSKGVIMSPKVLMPRPQQV